MKNLLLLCTLLATVAGAQTVNIPLTVTVTPTKVTIATTTSSTTIAVPQAPPVVTPPIVPPPATGVSWVYHNGAFLWAGDWSGTATTINYADTAGNPGGRDISLRSNSPWAYWLPYPPNGSPAHMPSFNTTGYNSLILSVKPTVAGQKWSLGAYTYTFQNGNFQGDIPTGPGVGDISKYCTAFVIAQWSTCVVPLSAMQATNLTTFYKFIMQDQSGMSGDVWYLNEVGFSP